MQHGSAKKMKGKSKAPNAKALCLPLMRNKIETKICAVHKTNRSNKFKQHSATLSYNENAGTGPRKALRWDHGKTSAKGANVWQDLRQDARVCIAQPRLKGYAKPHQHWMPLEPPLRCMKKRKTVVVEKFAKTDTK